MPEIVMWPLENVRERRIKPTLNKKEVRAYSPVSFTNVDMASGMDPSS